MPGLRRIGIGIAALALAALSASHALGRINERKQPAIAVGTVPINGTGLAEMAERILAGSIEQANAMAPKLNSAQSAEVASLSRKAFALEPLSVTALRNLALVAEAEGDIAKARTLMRNAARLSRRDFWTQTWLLRDYAKQGDLTNSLAAFDRTLRTSPSGQTRMLPAMFNLLARADLIEPLTMLLLKRPPWADAFWREAPKHPAGLANAAAIRAELVRQGIPGDENQNRALLNALAAAEEFAAVLQDNDAAVIIGSPTRGAGCGHARGEIETILSHSGARLRLPNCARLRADGTNEVGGIDPDILVGFRENDGPGRRVARLSEALPRALTPH